MLPWAWVLQTLVVLVLEGTLLVVLLLAGGVAFFMLHDPAVRRAAVIAKSFPQAPALPVIGHLLQIVKPPDQLFELLRDLRAKHGTRFVITLFGRNFFNISEPEAVEAVLSSSKHTTKGRVYDFLQPWLGQGLLTSNGKLWHSRRKLLTPAFHFRILDQFSEHLEKQAACLVDDLQALAANKEGPVDVVPVISRITLRSICVTAMGKVDFCSSSDAHEDGNEKSYFEAIHRVGQATVHRLIRPWLWPPPSFKMTSVYRTFRKDLTTLHNYTAKVIAERKRTLFDGEAGTAKGNDDPKRGRLQPFLDVLLTAQRDGADLSDRGIREEVDTFMFEGHDTTSMALSWALELVGRHADVQDRLADELLSADSDWDSIAKLPYLDRVLKECLRLRPSVPFISRLLSADAVLPDGKIIPAAAMVNVLIYDLHRDPRHFPDPERFDPDRFLPELEQARHPFAYVPFSAGPRNCIGKRFAIMEVKLLLSSVVRHFHIESTMSEKIDAIADLVLRPRDGVHLRLTPRARALYGVRDSAAR